jgi:tripeptide aminopeptidase
VRRASEAQRQRLHETFAELCRIESPSGNERACADWVAQELRELGLGVEEDDAGIAAGANAGNLLSRFAAPGAGEGSERASIMLCAHLDTVPPTAPIEPVCVDGGWSNANAGVLGADNKAAVAVLVELARGLLAAPQPSPAAVELVFTISEENGLHGAKAFDVTRLRSRAGFVFDHASPIGEIVLGSPTYNRVEAELRGRAAHAGVRPEDGRNAIAAAATAICAMPLGRLDAETTCNIGVIAGGTAANVVAERCRAIGEARSLSDQRVEEVVTAMVDAFQDAADTAECDLDVTVQRMFKGYRLKPREPHVAVAERALSFCGYEPRPIVSGGGSDANAFIENGFPCLNLANGTERNHEPDERVSVDSLEGMLEVALALVEQAGSTETAWP